MKIAPIFYGSVENGKLKIRNREKFDEYIANLIGEVVITVKKKRRTRTVNQNAYYWCILGIAADELGYDPDELHTSFRSMFLTDRTTKIPLIRSTAKLSTVDFGIYLDKVLKQIAELGIIIPTINEYYDSQSK